MTPFIWKYLHSAKQHAWFDLFGVSDFPKSTYQIRISDIEMHFIEDTTWIFHRKFFHGQECQVWFNLYYAIKLAWRGHNVELLWYGVVILGKNIKYVYPLLC